MRHSTKSAVRYTSPNKTDEERARHLSNSLRPRRPGEITCKDCGNPSTEDDKVWMGRRCRNCSRAWQRENLRVNPKTRRSALNASLRRSYGLTVDQWEAMVVAQGGKCAICGHTPNGDRGKKDSRLHVDHCHTTGKVRGLLCHQCNLLLGFAAEDPETLRNAADYLTRTTPEP